MSSLINNLGFLVLLVSLFGYISHYLNLHFLRSSLWRYSYLLGAIVHELSHALLCILTGAKIKEFSVFSRQPRVVHLRSRWGLIGQLLISLAPIAGGVAFLAAVNRFLLNDYFAVEIVNLGQLAEGIGSLLARFNWLSWQSWLMLFIVLNSGAMLGPSGQDLKNIWPAIVVLLFVSFAPLAKILLLALLVIGANIILQLFIILFLRVGRLLRSSF